MPYDSEFLDRLVSSMEVRSVSVTFSSKVSVKEDSGTYRGVESGMTVSLRVPGMESAPMEVVKLAALKYAPTLVTKVYTDLAVGDVMSTAEATARIKSAHAFYEAAYQKVLHDCDLRVGGDGVPDVGGADPSVASRDDSGA
jgi:hypothetical protein